MLNLIYFQKTEYAEDDITINNNSENSIGEKSVMQIIM